MIRVRVAVVVAQGNQVLLVRHDKDGRSYWLIPGGGVEVGESLDQAARRELLEETGLDVELDKLLWVSETLFPNQDRHILHMTFLGRAHGTISVTPDERLKAAQWFSGGEIAGLDLRPPLQAELAAGMNDGFAQAPTFLGARWVPEAKREESA